ncbi:MAG TPA: nicotinate-nucleotide adenylyltransferase [Bacteroidota bacterium]
MAQAKKRIGLFGGTFDPPHVGHLMIAEQARVQVRLDRVIFIPAFVPPHKRKQSSTKPEHRLRMTKLAVRGNRAFSVSDIEIRRGGVSYTIDTVNEYRRRFPRAELFLIIGTDNLRDFKKWKSYKEILRHANILVYPRSVRLTRTLETLEKGKVLVLRAELLDISSSSLRAAVRKKRSIRYVVPNAVKSYIESKRLYRTI